ncbi:alanine/ornithine racemase family PLP-dependent enzyme [Bacillus arachidis]|uniref:Alanine/ornithine racemase family PLP-dependent enzyme n=1 Tax=Bacillus arachidis TaxID=2819290 RepID=A0ABS3P1D3_9BACI|nr:alanine/ornithine racemase family PLP-dependent enzyme [Bacillus arachidis]MBO1626992.1 alanine/ornithine racemase family PLP-dependent enzyme [Bacillus arachidis]
MLPIMKINLSKLKHNAIMIKRLCERTNIMCFPVTKGVGAATEVIEILKDAGFTKFADSRLQHLQKIRSMMGNSVELLLIRTPALSEVEETVLTADISLNSELCVIEALGRAAIQYGKIHRVILMVDLGDLREGMLPEQMVEVAQRVVRMQGIELVGIGANFTCFSGVIPTESSMRELAQLTELVERKIEKPLSMISGGNSSSLPLILQKKETGRVNSLRIGEAIFLGKETAYGKNIPFMYQDIFSIEAEIIEIKRKSSMPRGVIGKNAFGQVPCFEEKGERLRAIVAIGRQDLDISGLYPLDENIEILGGSSDHLIVDITDSTIYRVGDTITFLPTYSGMQSGMISSLVQKQYVLDEVLQKALNL